MARNDPARRSLRQRVVCWDTPSVGRERGDSHRRIADVADDDLDTLAGDGYWTRLSADDHVAECKAGAETSKSSNGVATRDGCHVDWHGLKTAPYECLSFTCMRR